MGREHGNTMGPAVIDRPIVGSASAQMAPNAPEVVIQRARRRRRRRRAFAALALAGAVGLIAGLAAVFSSSPPNLPPNASPKAIAPRSHPILPTVTRSADGPVSWRGPMHSSLVFDTSVGLYFSWVTTWPGYGHRHGVLARVDPLTGAFIVVRSLRGWPAQAVAVDHSLFVGLTSQTSKVSGGRLVRMDPATLRIIRSWSLPAGTNLTSMVIAGGGLWIARGDTLDRLTPTRGTVTSSLRLPSAARVSLGTNGQGSVLVASADNPTGGYYLERVDPSTGAVELKSTLKIGDAAIGGIVQTAVWLSVATGTMGSVSLYDVRTLQPVGPRCHTGVSTQSCIVGVHSIGGEVQEGRLFVTTPNAETRNYCALPTGKDDRRAAGQREQDCPCHRAEVAVPGNKSDRQDVDDLRGSDSGAVQVGSCSGSIVSDARSQKADRAQWNCARTFL